MTRSYPDPIRKAAKTTSRLVWRDMVMHGCVLRCTPGVASLITKHPDATQHVRRHLAKELRNARQVNRGRVAPAFIRSIK